MSKEWYYLSEGNQVGPVSEEELNNKKNCGEIAQTDLVWSDGMTAWLPIHEVQQLAGSDSPTSHPPQGCITLEVAIEFLNDENTDEVEYGEHIEGLNWGTSIDKEAAEVLAKYHGILRLKGLTKISDDVAEALSRFKGEGLCLDGLVNVTEGNLEHLVNLETSHLQISGAIMNLANVSSFLAECHGTLILNGLPKISADAAKALSRFEGEALALDGLTELSDAVAESLSKHEGWLGLKGLTELSDAAAESLSKHEGDLLLEGLTELSDAAAESLSKHEGGLGLGGLTELSDAAAESLSKHKGELYLDGLTELSDAAAESLSKHKGEPNNMSKQVSAEMAGQGDPGDEFIIYVDFDYCDVNYSGYEILTRAQVVKLYEQLDTDRKIFTPNMPGEWYEEFDISLLKGAFTIHSESAEDIEVMRKLFGDAVGNTDLIVSVLDVYDEDNDDDSGDDEYSDDDDYYDDDDLDVAKTYDHISLDVAQKFLDHGFLEVDLEDATSIDSEAAELLSKSKEDQISLCGLTELPLDVAEGLAKYKGELFLRGLLSISDDVADALSKHEGGLHLDGLERISDSVACSLSKHKGEIELRGVVELSTRSAEALASSCHSLNLHGLTQISDSVARELAKHKTGCLYLGVTALSDTAAEALSNHQGESLWLIDLKEISDQGRAFLSSYKGVLNGHS